MGCMIARRLGLSSCAMLFLCGVFGGFLMAGMMMSSPPARPMAMSSAASGTSREETANSAAASGAAGAGSAGAVYDGTGGVASGGTGGALSAPSAPLPRPATRDELDTFEPVIKAPLTNVKSLPEGTVPRPRFYSQELGTHQKLYVAVLTSPETVHREATNINHTLAHITSSIGFYMVGDPEMTLPKNLQNVVIFPQEDNAPENLPLRTAQYLAAQFGNQYDYFFIVRDNTYVRGYRLKELAEDLSVGADVLLGARHGDTCKLDGGLLLSRQLLVNTNDRKTECDARLASSGLTGDRALISCLELLGGTRCTDRAQGKWFVSQLASLYDPAADGDLPGLVSVQAVHSATEHGRLHAAFARLEIAEIDERIGQLRRALEDNQSNLHKLSRSKAGDDSKDDGGEPEPLPWPTGSPQPVRTASRHHINMWQRFSESDMFLRSEQTVVDPHTEVDRLDIEDVMALGMAELRKTAPLQLVGLRAGYRRFDGARGMDYILDLEVQPEAGGAVQVRRVEVHRPILKAELVPVPFVTEKPTVSLVLPVRPEGAARAQTFVQQLITRSENVGLLLVLVPGAADPALFDPLRALAHTANERRGGATAAGARRFEAVVWPHAEPPSQFELVDLAAAHTDRHWEQALVLLLSEPIEFNSELLNRARMQTIRGWEVFAPIPWVEYHPSIGYFGTSSLQPDKLELRKDYGHFDGEHYAIMSFYMDDYKAVREKTLDDVPMSVPSGGGGGGGGAELPYDLYGAFVKFSGLHVHRAVDPSFRLYYFERTCPAPARHFYQRACENSRLHGLGPHDKLSHLLRDYHQAQSDDGQRANAI